MRKRRKGYRKIVKKEPYLINQNIVFPEIRLIIGNKDKSKEVNLGIVPLAKGLEIAKEKDLDLICISPKAKIPVCKIFDYGKFKFEHQKREKQNRKKQTRIIKKEYRLGILTSDYDISYRKKQIIESLKKGYHIKVSLKLYGRFLGIEGAGFDILNKLANELKEYADIEKAPEKASKRYVDLYLVPNKQVLKEVKRRKKEQLKTQQNDKNNHHDELKIEKKLNDDKISNEKTTTKVDDEVVVQNVEK